MSCLPTQPVRNAQVLKWCCILFFVSLVIRLAFWVPVIRGNTLAIWDEYEYVNRAIGFQNALTDLLQGKLPSSGDLAQAYSEHWPPVQAFVLSLGFLAFGSTLAVGRAMMILLSAATAPLVYLVTCKLSDKRAALVASVGFGIYPSLIHYSLQMLSETTYIFIWFLMLYIALMTVEEISARKKVYLAIATGCLLGLGTLTRAAGLLAIPMVALWLGWHSNGLGRILLPIIILVSAGVTLLPWEIALFAVGGRFTVVAGTSDLNLYQGNNPWLPDGYGSGGQAVTQHVYETANQYSAQHGVSFYAACRALALQEITRDPVHFFRRGLDKLRAMWSADFTLLRHVLMVVYPPMSDKLASLVWFTALTSLFVLLALVIWGLGNPKLCHRDLIVGLVLAGTIPGMMGIGQPRLGIPLLAVLLPAAGHGLVHLESFKNRGARPWAIATLGVIILVSVFIYTGLPFEYSKLEPSSHNLNLVRQLDRWFGHQTDVSDRWLFRVIGHDHPEQVNISIVGNDFEFADLGTRTYRWNTLDEAGVLNLVVHSQTASQPFQLQLELYEQSVALTPSDRVWQTWQPSGLPGIEYMWIGSSRLPLNAMGLG